ncbi:NFACT family protein [Candidatus Woesearchaeota archaeon]|nr:NFACT family protein [Candidatus Woesearchaeota archaeon]
MKSLSAVEIYFIRKELENLIGARFDKIYQPNKEEFILVFNKEGNILIKVLLGKAIFLTTEKKPEITGFCTNLKRHIDNFKLIEIKQNNFERILEFHLESKLKKILIIELFSKGNIILCDKDYNIILALQQQTWKDRTIKPKETYKYPPAKHCNPLVINLKEFKETINKSDKENIVKTLAMNFALGGLYAEEVCLRARIDKNEKELTDEESEGLYQAIKDLELAKINANSIENLDATPFDLEYYKNYQKKYFKSFSEALEHYYNNYSEDIGKFDSKLEKLNKILEEQKKHIKEINDEYIDSKKKADLIYENYSYVKEVLDTIRNARERNIPWNEIKEKLKTKGIEVLEKEGKVIVSL